MRLAIFVEDVEYFETVMMEPNLVQWQELSSQWWQNASSVDTKELLTSAYAALGATVPLLRAGQPLPKNLDPLTLASDAFTYCQTREHLIIGLELLELAIQFEIAPGITFRAACPRDNGLRSSCQDAHALHCWHLSEAAASAPPADKAAAAGAVDRCLATSREFLPSPMAWTDAALVTRQLPALRHRPIWDARALPWTPILQRFDAQLDSIRTEVMGSMRSSIWLGGGNDLRLSTNAAWDPHTSWDAVARETTPADEPSTQPSKALAHPAHPTACRAHYS